MSNVFGSIRPSATTETVLYTVPPGREAIVNILAVCASGYVANIRIGVQSTAGAFAAKDYVLYDYNLNANDFWERTGIALTAGNSIRVYTDQPVVNFHYHAVEEGI